ncbi:MAG: DUF4974 domain-containing protein [Odoribacter sp.]|nr:DUF4974 domain-containing protein [Odoribacter sp.]
MMDNLNFEKRNRGVFDSMPNTPYLGELPHLSKGGSSVWGVVTKVAAVLSIPLALYFFITLYANRSEVVPETSPEISNRIYTVENGVKGKVTLPDSTVVWLNCGTTLALSDDFNQQRWVTLSGEAYFDVKADKQNPFYINTGKGVTVKVTGTEFNLSCYNDQNDVRLCLLEGSVELLSGKKTIYKMTQHEEVSILNSNVAPTKAEAEVRTAWMQGRLLFDDTPMEEVVKKLEKWYGVRIKVQNSKILKSSFTGDFQSESIIQVLELMKITSAVNYRIEGNEVSIY